MAAPERARESQSKPESGKESQWKPEWELQKAINSQLEPEKKTKEGQLELEREP